jgi:hypothetical protein
MQIHNNVFVTNPFGTYGLPKDLKFFIYELFMKNNLHNNTMQHFFGSEKLKSFL